MSGRGEFDYPSEDVLMNFNDELIISWSSDFVDTLVVTCTAWYFDIDNTASKTYLWNNIPLTGTEQFSPVELERDFDDWTHPAECALNISQSGGADGNWLPGSTISVTSVATQPASLLAQFSTVAYYTSGVISTSSSSSPTSTPSATPTSPIIPTSTPTPNPGLTERVKIGIGAGIGIGVMFIAVVVFLFYRNHRRVKTLEDRLSYVPQVGGGANMAEVTAGQSGNQGHQEHQEHEEQEEPQQPQHEGDVEKWPQRTNMVELGDGQSVNQGHQEYQQPQHNAELP